MEGKGEMGGGWDGWRVGWVEGGVGDGGGWVAGADYTFQ